MIITKKQLPRRTFLKGLGVAVALPMLDALTPALASPADKLKTPLRLAFAYVPNGIEMKAWTPKGVGKDFEFTRILKPLEPFREDLLVLEDLPVIILGRGNGNLKPGRHIVYPEKPPMTNLFLTLLDKLGVLAEKLGDSTGRVEHLSEV